MRRFVYILFSIIAFGGACGLMWTSGQTGEHPSDIPTSTASLWCIVAFITGILGLIASANWYFRKSEQLKSKKTA